MARNRNKNKAKAPKLTKVTAEELEILKQEAEEAGEELDEALYKVVDETEEDEDEDEVTKFTYIGAGDSPPRKINFMGLQPFVRGKATVVTNPIVLAKLKGHPCFVEGEVDEEELAAQDEEADEAANEQRAFDNKLNKAYKQKHGMNQKDAE